MYFELVLMVQQHLTFALDYGSIDNCLGIKHEAAVILISDSSESLAHAHFAYKAEMLKSKVSWLHKSCEKWNAEEITCKVHMSCRE